MSLREIRKQYNVIYADPPWHYKSKELQKYGGQRFTPLEKHYKTQTESWIRKLPVGNLSKEDCALFLWTTDAHLDEAIHTIKAWGFKYVTVAFVWEKLTTKGNTVSNLGAWTMKNFELCLLGTKGHMLKYKKSNNVRQKIREQRTKHSRKPTAVRTAIEKLFGNVPKIELFARERFEGWDSWGDELT